MNFGFLFRVALPARRSPIIAEKLSSRCIAIQSLHIRNINPTTVNKLCPIYPLHFQPARGKYNKKSNQSADEDDDAADSALNRELEDIQDEQDAKVIKTSVKSLRLDLVLKAGLGLARNKVETIFYANRIRVNGVKVAKKSMLVGVGDEVDVVKGFSPANPAHLLVARVQVLAEEAKDDEGYRIAMKRFKTLIIENYSGPNAWKSSSQ